ncbi:NF038122 family metalloprotease [Bythopirellula polymerisocia]|uniref:PEP-CTERM protein-sorting domain-containing protein n=1 Tax=Bythopirellula polymerisocia TaxID=2528003 RepID=A0A5C6CUU2_9BACT|nr:NF038122 family metalloprotease [Bythopirellula polymerisocia]TWU28312.1 hypothetical protein Pla144_15990 [Bythopirellula polymerisocia]
MNRTSGLCYAARRTMSCCALAILFEMSFSTYAFSLMVDNGQTQQPASVASQMVPMPVTNPSFLRVSHKNIVLSLSTFDIVINAGPTLAGNAPALAAFNRAAQQWEAFIADPITVTIDADLGMLDAGILGGTDPVLLFDTFDVIRNAMADDAADNETDDSIVSSLPNSSQYVAFVPTGFGFNGDLSLTKANAKALNFDNRFGDLDAQFGVADAEIIFSSTFAFDFDNSDGVTPGTFDFETVATHEIGHVLGFLSDVDFVDFVLDLGETSTDITPTTLDLFRFESGTNPSSPAEFTNTPRWMVPGFNAIFDQIDGSFGGDAEVLMATGLNFGDGRQASHWKDGLSLGIMDPTLSFGEISPIRPNDLRALDLIGYEISIPEPASLILLLGISCFATGLRTPGLIETASR